MDDLDDGRPFSDDERREIRRRLETDRRIEWFWGGVRIWIQWIAAGCAAAYGVYQAIKDTGFFRKLGGP